MDKVKYTLLQRPTVSNWPAVPRTLKLALGVTVFLVVVLLVIYRTPRHIRIEKILHVQEFFADIFDLEVEAINLNEDFFEDQWQPVEDLDGDIYSAYFDPRPEVIDQHAHWQKSEEITWGLIRIIAILPMSIEEQQVDCIYKFVMENNTHVLKRIRASSVKPIEDNWNLKYSAFFVICELIVTDKLDPNFEFAENQLPNSVGIAAHQDETVDLRKTLRFVNVHYPNWSTRKSYEMQEFFMAVCAPVFHHNFNRPLDVVEFVEYYLLLGASHFTFYNSSVSPDVDRVLQYYAKRQIASVLSWQLPSKYVFERTLRYEGLFAGINDCLYRNTFHDNYHYTAFFGIDDFLVPKMYENLPELMEHLDPVVEKGNKHASFLFRNAFFYTMYQDDWENRDRSVPYLYTQAKTWRVKEPQMPGVRSRYIVRGRDVVEVGNYKASEFRQGSHEYADEFDEIVVSPEVALSHHYSPCEAEETGCYLKNIVVDRTAHKYTKRLGPMVATACKNIFGTTGCPFVEKQRFA